MVTLPPSPAAADLANLAVVVAMAIWVTVLGVYIVRSVAWWFTGADPYRTVPLPARTLAVVAGVNLAAACWWAAVTEWWHLDPLIAAFRAGAVVFWILVVGVLVVFDRGYRRRTMTVQKQLDRYDYRAAVADRRRRMGA